MAAHFCFSSCITCFYAKGLQSSANTSLSEFDQIAFFLNENSSYKDYACQSTVVYLENPRDLISKEASLIVGNVNLFIYSSSFSVIVDM